MCTHVACNCSWHNVCCSLRLVSASFLYLNSYKEQYTAKVSAACKLRHIASRSHVKPKLSKVLPAHLDDTRYSSRRSGLQQELWMFKCVLIACLCLFLAVRVSCAWQPPKAASICPAAVSRASHVNLKQTAIMAVSFWRLDPAGC